MGGCCAVQHSQMLDVSVAMGQSATVQALISKSCEDLVNKTWFDRTQVGQHFKLASQEATSRSRAYQQLQGAVCLATTMHAISPSIQPLDFLVTMQGIDPSNQLPDLQSCR